MASREEIEAKKAAGLCVKAGCGSRAFERWTYCEKHLPRSFSLARTIRWLKGPPHNPKINPPRQAKSRDSN
jgi:hypothetical protein